MLFEVIKKTRDLTWKEFGGQVLVYELGTIYGGRTEKGNFMRGIRVLINETVRTATHN